MKTKILSSLVFLAFISGSLVSCSNNRRRSRTESQQNISGSGHEEDSIDIASAENQPAIRRRSNSRGSSHQANISTGMQELETQTEEESIVSVPRYQPAILRRTRSRGRHGGSRRGSRQQPGLGPQETEAQQDQFDQPTLPLNILDTHLTGSVPSGLFISPATPHPQIAESQSSYQIQRETSSAEEGSEATRLEIVAASSENVPVSSQDSSIEDIPLTQPDPPRRNYPFDGLQIRSVVERREAIDGGPLSRQISRFPMYDALARRFGESAFSESVFGDADDINEDSNHLEAPNLSISAISFPRFVPTTFSNSASSDSDFSEISHRSRSDINRHHFTDFPAFTNHRSRDPQLEPSRRRRHLNFSQNRAVQNREVPVPELSPSFPFDVTDELLMPFVSELARTRPTGVHSPSLPLFCARAQYISEATGEVLYASLPLTFSRNVSEFVDDSDSDESSEDEIKVDSTEKDDPVEQAKLRQNEQSTSTSQSTSVSTPVAQNTNPFVTPKRVRNSRNTCPDAPRCFPIIDGNSYQDAQGDSLLIHDDDFEMDLCGANESGLSKSNNSGCARAERKFQEHMQTVHKAALRHTEFAIQEILFDTIEDLESSVPLNTEHLRAFEVDFDIFLKLVMNCPQKYLLPALALSLQYDEDFPKFLALFYKGKTAHYYGLYSSSFFQSVVLSFILNMPRISNSAHQFFSSPKNSVIVFADFRTHPHFYGKFSLNILASTLSKYEPIQMDYSSNLLRSWLLEFNYADFIDELWRDNYFSTQHFEIISKARKLFSSETKFNLAQYKLFKSVLASANYEPYYTFGIIHQKNQIRSVLNAALSQEDLEIVRVLFWNFNLEKKSVKILHIQHPKQTRSVHVTKINRLLCLVRIFDDGFRFSVLLPFSNKF